MDKYRNYNFNIEASLTVISDIGVGASGARWRMFVDFVEGAKRQLMSAENCGMIRTKTALHISVAW